MSDHPALVTFSQGWGFTGKTSEDGFPLFEDTVLISIERPPLSKLDRVAVKQDFLDHPAEYEAYQATEKAKRNTGEEGYPLVYWPAATAAEVKMLAARNVTTVEALAKLAGNRDLPGQLADLALRAERMIDMQKQFGKYETLLHDHEATIEVLTEQNKELTQSLAAAKTLIETLKSKVQ